MENLRTQRRYENLKITQGSQCGYLLDIFCDVDTSHTSPNRSSQTESACASTPKSNAVAGSKKEIKVGIGFACLTSLVNISIQSDDLTVYTWENMGNGCFTKHPLKHGCLEFQVHLISTLNGFL